MNNRNHKNIIINGLFIRISKLELTINLPTCLGDFFGIKNSFLQENNFDVMPNKMRKNIELCKRCILI